MKTWNSERRLAFQKKHKKAIDNLEFAKRQHFPNYTDAEVALKTKELESFLVAYHQEQKLHTKETTGAGDV